ncbi:MAG: hypothetical protein DRP01_11055 [Archaeoglobales archaeon]|nr:MAG: hypothetical protein DRP01_11055 [Archaeoglobales archaeon]
MVRRELLEKVKKSEGAVLYLCDLSPRCYRKVELEGLEDLELMGFAYVEEGVLVWRCTEEGVEVKVIEPERVHREWRVSRVLEPEAPELRKYLLGVEGNADR